MAYPRYWQAIMAKLQDFRWDIGRAKHKRKPVRITIEYHHKTFGAESKKITALDLKTPEMEEITDLIAEILKKKELELEAKIKDYESREGETV